MDIKDEVKMRIWAYRLSNNWVIYQLQSRGFTVDKSEFSAFLSGVRQGNKADAILAESKAVLDDYERQFLKATS